MKNLILITSIIINTSILILFFTNKDHITSWQYIIMLQLFSLINKDQMSE